MEKLVKLLNEYVGQDSYWIDEYDNGAFITWGDGDQCFIDEHIISKNFGFIKWLVEKDNIDFDKCGLDIKKYLSYNKRYDKGIVMAENYDNDTFEVREFYSPYEQLLMLLAIQDNPIEFLISILR